MKNRKILFLIFSVFAVAVCKACAGMQWSHSSESPPIAAATAAASGLLSVKSILAVKVPGASGGGTPIYNAPQINSTLLTQAKNGVNNGVQNVNVVNTPDKSKQDPIRAFVVEKDITSKQQRTDYLDRQSTI